MQLLHCYCLLLLPFHIHGAEKVDSNKISEENRLLSSKEVYGNLKKSIKSIRESCGEVCDTTISQGIQGQYYEHIVKKVNCPALFGNPDIDEPAEFTNPPARIPKWLKDDYSYGGRVTIINTYLDDSKGVTHEVNWTNEYIQRLMDAFLAGRLAASYGIYYVREIDRHIQEHLDVEGKHVLVYGSQSPWLEVILLAAGVTRITTLDYVKIHCEHKQIETITPDEMAAQYLNGTLPRYDAMVTFSSLEHSGLGRYGDNLNPWGDLIAMARVWCVMKPGARVLVGVPTGPDEVLFNACKTYGPLMYAHLFANWKQIYTETDFDNYNKDCKWCYQPLHILER